MLRQGHLARRRGRVLRPPRVYGPGLSVGYRSVLSGRRRLHEECRLLRRRLCPQLLRVRPELLRAGRNVQERRLRPLHDAVRLEVLRRRRVLRIAEAEPLLQNRLRRVSGSEERRWRLLRPKPKVLLHGNEGKLLRTRAEVSQRLVHVSKGEAGRVRAEMLQGREKVLRPEQGVLRQGRALLRRDLLPEEAAVLRDRRRKEVLLGRAALREHCRRPGQQELLSHGADRHSERRPGLLPHRHGPGLQRQRMLPAGKSELLRGLRERAEVPREQLLRERRVLGVLSRPPRGR